jgi:hypothetical protein
MNSPGWMIVAPSGDLLDVECADLSSGGSELWKLPNVAGSPQNCYYAVTDTEGNSYIFGLNEKGESAVESVDSAGKARWTTTTGSYSQWRTTPVLGSNGDVYFSAFNGRSSEVLGLDEHTGAITLEDKFTDVTGLYAYAGGLVVVSTDRDIEYLGYDGTVEHVYNTGPAISAYEAYSNSGGANGTVFVAGYGNGCGSSSHASVEKVTPTGVAWTWTDTAEYCNPTLLAATPDGGVIFAREKTNPSADYTSISPAGIERWTDVETGPTGTAEYGGIYPVRVDVNGVVALPAGVSYSCTRQPSEECPGAQVEYLTEGTGAPALPPLLITGSAEGGFSLISVATDTERIYLSGEAIEDNVPVETAIFAFAVPGLGKDYQLSLQEALTSGGGSPPDDGGGITVQNPPPQPPLTVTVANGGGGGVAGQPDPSSFEHGACDPGANTSWLNIAGTTFTCIVSGDIWDDPTLISAKKKCVISLGIDFVPFAKALKAPKYVKEAESVKTALHVLAQRLAATSYPGKVSGDVQAISDIETGLDLVRNPNQAILTIVSSRRVLDGLITKLGKGGKRAAKVAHDLAVVKSAVTTLIKTVSGIQDIQDCITAFNAP